MFQIVAARDEAKFGRHNIGLPIIWFVSLNAVGMSEVIEYIFNKFVQKLLDGLVVTTAEVVVVRIFQDPAEEEGPGYPLNAILTVVDLPSSYFCVHMVVQLLEQTWLYWEGVVQELSVEVFLWWLAVYHCHSPVVELRSACSSYHLQQVGWLEIYVFMRFWVEIFCAFDQDQSCREIDSPSQRRCCNHNLNKVFDKKLLAKLPVTVVKTCVMKSNSKIQSLLQKLISGPLNSSLQHLLITVNIRRFLSVLHLAKSNEIAGCESGLPSGWDKDDDWLAITEFFDVVVGRFVHGCHSWAIVLLTEAFEVNLNGNWSNRGSEVEKSVSVSAKPFSNISTIGHGSWQTNHPHFSFFIHPWNNHLKDCPSFLSEQMNLIEDDQANLLSVLSLFASGYAVPFFRGCYDHICSFQTFYVRSEVTTKFNYWFF